MRRLTVAGVRRGKGNNDRRAIAFGERCDVPQAQISHQPSLRCYMPVVQAFAARTRDGVPSLADVAS